MGNRYSFLKLRVHSYLNCISFVTSFCVEWTVGKSSHLTREVWVSFSLPLAVTLRHRVDTAMNVNFHSSYSPGFALSLQVYTSFTRDLTYSSKSQQSLLDL